MFRSTSDRRFRLVLTASLLLLATTAVSAATHRVNVAGGLTTAGAPLALRGYDPVAYFADGKATAGKASQSVAHQGATYRFASKKNRQRFEQDPERYLPQYGGYCAYGVSVGAKFDGDPTLWKVIDGKLYLNLNQDIQKAWNADPKGAIDKADGHWPRIRDAAPATLTPEG